MKSLWLDALSLMIIGVLAIMTAVFFACGDDDDDDADTVHCEDYLAKINDCTESSYDFWMWWRHTPNELDGKYDDSFLSWCTGEGNAYLYGEWSGFVFNPGCFEGTCEEILERNVDDIEWAWVVGECLEMIESDDVANYAD